LRMGAARDPSSALPPPPRALAGIPGAAGIRDRCSGAQWWGEGGSGGPKRGARKDGASGDGPLGGELGDLAKMQGEGSTTPPIEPSHYLEWGGREPGDLQWRDGPGPGRGRWGRGGWGHPGCCGLGGGGGPGTGMTACPPPRSLGWVRRGGGLGERTVRMKGQKSGIGSLWNSQPRVWDPA